MKNKLLKILSILLVFTIILSGCGQGEAVNISNGNIANGGHISVYDDSIYYSLGGAIYKCNEDGTNVEQIHQLSEDKEYQSTFTIVNDWIYFYQEDGDDTFLCKIKTNGKSFTKISEVFASFGIRAYNKYLYLGNEYKMKIGGNELTRLDDNFIMHNDCTNIVDNKIYYIDTKYGDMGSDYGIYVMDLDNGDIVRISDEAPEYMIVDGEWIYYSHKYSRGSNRLDKMKTDGSEEQQVDGYNIKHINTVGDWIIGYMTMERTEGIYAVKKDGSENKLLIENENYELEFGGIYIIGDWLYYETYDNNYASIFRLTMDNTEPELFAQIEL